MENLASTLKFHSLEAKNNEDIIIMKMLVNFANIIYCYKAVDTVKTFIEMNTGLKFSAV